MRTPLISAVDASQIFLGKFEVLKMGEVIFFFATILRHFAGGSNRVRAGIKVLAWDPVEFVTLSAIEWALRYLFPFRDVARSPQSRSPPFFHNSVHSHSAEPPDNMSEVGPSSPFGESLSPLTVPSSTTTTPGPVNQMPERDFWVELRPATKRERNRKEFHLNLLEIAAEHTEGSKEFYYVLLGDKKYHKVRAPARDPINLDLPADASSV